MKDTLSAAEARRIALAAQGFGGSREGAVTPRHLAKLVDRLGVIQIDSVNVVSRTHYLPAFSRLGAYPREMLEDLAWGKKRPLFEYWAHEASLLPLSSQPLFRWRMDDALNGVGAWKGIARFLRERRDFVDRALDEVARRGPLSASELEIGGKGAGGWWGWSEAKRAVEGLFWTGELTTATRRGTFERVYGLPEKIHPRATVDTPTPPRDEAQREIVMIAARAMGVATMRDLRDYFRMGVEDIRARVGELVEAAEVQGPFDLVGCRLGRRDGFGCNVKRGFLPGQPRGACRKSQDAERNARAEHGSAERTPWHLGGLVESRAGGGGGRAGHLSGRAGGCFAPECGARTPGRNPRCFGPRGRAPLLRVERFVIHQRSVRKRAKNPKYSPSSITLLSPRVKLCSTVFCRCLGVFDVVG